MAFNLRGEKGNRSSSKRRQSGSPGGATRSSKAARHTKGKNEGKEQKEGKGREQEKEEGQVYSTDEEEFEHAEDNLEDVAGDKWG